MSIEHSLNAALCVLPWNHLATHPNGEVSLCCRVDFAKGAGFSENTQNETRQKLNLQNQDLTAIANSDSFKRTRLEMLAGKFPAACSGCYRLEEQGIESKRQLENRNFPHSQESLQSITARDGSITPRYEFVELRLGNLCNLKCRTCNPNSSTNWRSDYLKLQSELSFVQNYGAIDASWCESENFWKKLEKHTASETLFYINGGEPTLIEAHWDFLERLARKGKSKNTRLWYNSNMTILPDKAFRIWKEFSSVQVSASIDDLRERNHYIRYPADWAKIEANLNRLQENNIQVSITQTVSAMNFFYLDEFHEWAASRGLWAEHNFVHDPDFLSVQALPKLIRQKIANKLSANFSSKQKSQIQFYANLEDKPMLWTHFQEYTKSLDRIRGQNFGTSFPDLAKVLDWSS